MTTILLEQSAPKTVCKHLVTLINRMTGDEVCLTVETASDRFADVVREVACQKVERKLRGYEIFEVLDLNCPF